ncbi:hypothetical protein T265_08429 [Opisthorchis viverrini]|uniref:Metallo-beta-lactamase domain-containing protein n=1 Tax=Opisthorchis viverrini TaxID=6198 RepID=A0A074Z9F7_OPIVI|nr:hypothetical protein T265_08429 [Opisthorchis viverrini]KER23738.1 hypothetical protein T265_08429 [Opisthorchis viverrini]
MSFRGESANAFFMHVEERPENLMRIDAKMDLGNCVSSNLSFSLSRQKSAQNAFAILRLIRRTFSRITRMDFQILYGAYFRPLLKYANQVGYSGCTKNVTLIDRVQRAATRMFAGLKSVDYETRLAMLDLFLLEYRRPRGDLILTYALFERSLANRFLPLTQQTPDGDIVRKISSSEHAFIRQFFFSFLVVGAWNDLPPTVRKTVLVRPITIDKPGMSDSPFRCLAAVPHGDTRAGILSSCPSLDKGSREPEVGFQPRPFRKNGISVKYYKRSNSSLGSDRPNTQKMLQLDLPCIQGRHTSHDAYLLNGQELLSSTNTNSDIHNPCYLLHLRDVNVLLDCCIETSALVHFLPSHQLLTPGCSDLPVPTHEDVSVAKKSHATSVPATQDDCQVTIGDNIYLRSKPQFCLMNKTEFASVIWDAVDVILVSNTNSILGLPFICSATNFRGRILATEPVVKFGKVLMEDLLDALEQLPPCKRYPVEQLKQDPKQPRSFLHDFLGANDRVWKEFYSRQTIKDTLDRIQLVAYHEPVDIFGLLTICSSSAGFGLGSCNWTVNSPTEKVAYISHTSLLYSHVLPFDDSLLADVDVLIMGTVNLLASTQLERTVNEFRHIVVQTLARGGHVLVPINPCGMLFDLIETAIHAKENFKGTIQPLFPREKPEPIGNGQSHVPPTTTSVNSGRDSVFLDSTEGNTTHNSSSNNSVTPLGGSSSLQRADRWGIRASHPQLN